MSRKTFSMTSIVLLSLTTLASAATHIAKPVERLKKAETTEEIAKVKAVLTEGNKQKKDWLNTDLGRMANTRSIKVYLPRLSTSNIRIGDVGVFMSATTNGLIDLKVIHVLNKKSLIVEIPRVRTIKGEKAKKEGEETKVCLEGISTSGIADNDLLEADVLFEAIRTDKFGSTTLLVLEPFPYDLSLAKTPKGKTNPQQKKKETDKRE